MAGVLQHLRSSTLDKRPNPASMVDGQVAINYASGSPGMFFKDSNGDLVKVGPVHVGSTAPNVSPASGGTAGNSKGEQWLDTTGGTYVFKIWDGSAWRSETGEFVNVTGDTMTGALGIIAGSASTPGLFFSGDANTGVYAPSADQLAITTGGTARFTTTTTAITSALPVDVPLGSASAPSLTFTGDTNTGIYSPGADQVAISTNGTGRLFVDSSGRVGIGVSGNLQSTFNIVGGQGVTWKHPTDATLYSDIYGDASANIIFRNGASLTERLRITSDGKVGLGTSSPGESLHTTGKLRVGDGGNYTVAAIQLGSSNANGISYPGTNILNFITNSTAALTIDGSQRVGVGTTSPNQLLQVNGSGVDARIQLTNSVSGSTNSDGFHLQFNNSDIFFDNKESGNFIFQSGATEAARIDSSRRLLVGTSSDLSGGDADARLQVNGDAGAQILLSRQDFSALTAGTLIGEVVFRSQASGVKETSALIKCEADATQGSGDKPGRLVFSTTADGASSPTERMRISSNGRINNFSSGDGLVNGVSAGAGTAVTIFVGKRSATSTADGTDVFYVFSNGNVQNTNNSYGAISDIKLKENIVDAGSQWNDVKALQVRKYNFKEGQTHTQIGLIAQEVELVSPGLVYESPDRDTEGNDLGTVTKSVNYSVLYMKAVKALQEAMERIETLEASNTDLLARVSALESA